MVSCQKGPTRHAYAWQIGPFWQDTLDIKYMGGPALLLGTQDSEKNSFDPFWWIVTFLVSVK